jgi:hypothetical protein
MSFVGISREGIYPRFPKLKTYQKNLRPPPKAWNVERLAALKRFSKEGPFYLSREAKRPFGPGLASTFLLSVGLDKACDAIQAALRGEDDWFEPWRQWVSYAYWSHRVSTVWNVHGRPQVLNSAGVPYAERYASLFLARIGATIGNCLSLGWTEFAISLTESTNASLRTGTVVDGGHWGSRRTQHFMLRLVGDWQGWPPRQPTKSKDSKIAFDEPLFNALAENWRTTDLAAIEFLLLAACDRHTQQSRTDSGNKFCDMRDLEHYFDPFEVLSVLRLRELNGLENPSIDHLLTASQLGRLQPVSQPYHDELLDGLLRHGKQAWFPEL